MYMTYACQLSVLNVAELPSRHPAVNPTALLQADRPSLSRLMLPPLPHQRLLLKACGYGHIRGLHLKGSARPLHRGLQAAAASNKIGEAGQLGLWAGFPALVCQLLLGQGFAPADEGQQRPAGFFGGDEVPPYAWHLPLTQ